MKKFKQIIFHPTFKVNCKYFVKVFFFCVLKCFSARSNFVRRERLTCVKGAASERQEQRQERQEQTIHSLTSVHTPEIGFAFPAKHTDGETPPIARRLNNARESRAPQLHKSIYKRDITCSIVPKEIEGIPVTFRISHVSNSMESFILQLDT